MAPPKTAFIYGSFNQIPENELTLQGDATAPGDVLYLTKVDADTNPVPHSKGRVLYAPQIEFSNGRSSQAIFETTFTFKIASKSNASITAADGIAFFIAPVDTDIPPDAVGASLGIFDGKGESSNLFAVEFDTFANSFEQRQATGPHIGIDINSWISKAIIPFDGFFNKKVTATITYREKKVTVVAVTDTKTTDTKTTDTKTFTVSYDYDLSLALNQQVQVGISASTGDFSEGHYLYSWSFASALVRNNE